MRQSGERKKRRFGYPPEPDTETLPGTETSEDRGIPGTEYMASETAPNGPFGRGPQHAASSRTRRISSPHTVVSDGSAENGKAMQSPSDPSDIFPTSPNHGDPTPRGPAFSAPSDSEATTGRRPFFRKFPQDKPFARFRTNGPKIRGFIDRGSAFRPSRIVCRSRRHAPRRKPSPSACARPSPFTARADCIPVFRCR